MAYDRQVVVQLDFDQTISRNAEALNKYGNDRQIPSELLKVRGSNTGFNGFDIAKLNVAMSKLTRDSRVYLQAHGDWQTQCLSSYTGEQVAEMLVRSGMPAVKVVSVLGCESARDAGTADDMRVSHSMDSFASHFHKALRDIGGLKVSVYARTLCVGIGNPEEETGALAQWHGHKATFNDDDDWEGWGSGHQRTESKLHFFWVDDAQQREWMY